MGLDLVSPLIKVLKNFFVSLLAVQRSRYVNLDGSKPYINLTPSSITFGCACKTKRRLHLYPQFRLFVRPREWHNLSLKVYFLLLMQKYMWFELPLSTNPASTTT